MAKNKKHGRGIDEEEERSGRESGRQSTSDSYSADTFSGSSSYIRDQYNEYKRNPTKFRQNEQTQRYTKTPEYISAAKNYNRSNFEYKQSQRFRDNFYDYYPELKAQDDLQSRLDSVNSIVPNFRNDGFSNRLQQKQAEDIERNWQKYINSGDREAVLKANSDFDETNDVKTKEEKFSEAAQKYQRMMEGESARGNYGKAIDYAILAQESQKQASRQSGMSYYGEEAAKGLEENGIDYYRYLVNNTEQNFNVIDSEIEELERYNRIIDDNAELYISKRDGTYERMLDTQIRNNERIAELQKQRDDLKKYIDYNDEFLAAKSIKSRYGAAEYYQSHFGYAQSERDFAENSKYIPHEYTVDENNAAFLHELVNGNKEAWEDERKHLGGVSSFLGLSREYINSLSDEEIAVFNYLYETESPERAMSYIKYKQSALEQRRMDEKLEPYLKFADEHPFWASVASGAASPLKMISHTGQLLDYSFLSGEVNPNADYNVFSNAINGVRAEVSKDFGDTGRYLYNTGMSMLDSAASRAFGPYASLVVMGGEAASDAVLDAKRRGLSDDAAFFTGMCFGAVEAITEKLGVDAWFKAMNLISGALKQSAIEAFKQACISILQSALSEAAEEGIADILDCIIDVTINGNKSEIISQYNKLVANGMSEKEAFGSVAKDKLIELGLDSLGGFISGGVMTGGSAIAVNTFYGATSNVRNSAENAKLLGENFSNKENGVADLVKTAAALGVKSNVTAESTNEYRIGKLAENVQEKLQTQFKGVDAATAETVYQNMVSEYGETVKPLVQRAYASEVYGEIKSAKTTQEVAQKVSEITKNADEGSETARIAREIAVEKAVQIETENAKTFKVSRRSISEVTIKNENGKAETAQIEKMDKEGRLVLDNGQTVSSDDVDISDSVIEIQSLAKTYDLSGADTAKLFNMTLDHAKSFPSANVYDYFSQLVHAYEQGQGGKYTQQQAAKSFSVKGLLPVDHDLAYSLGRSRFDEASRQRAERLAQLKETAKMNGVTERRGTVDKSALADKNGRIKMNSDRAFAIRLSQAIAETLGVDVKLVEGDSRVEGNYGDRTITINVDQLHRRPGETVKGAITRVFSHEITHSFEENSETYKELRQFCFEYAAAQIGVDAVEAKIAGIQSNLKEAGFKHDRTTAEFEFVAQSCEQMLQNSDMLVELYKRSTTLYQRFVDAINELFAKLKKIVSAVNENAKLMQGGMDQLQKLWDKCYAEASETIKNTALEKSGEVEYSIYYPTFSDEDIINNSIKLQSMENVATLTERDFGNRNKPLSERIASFFESLGNNVYSKQFGDVALTKSSVRSEMRHGSTPIKVITYAAIPSVIQNGVVINTIQKNERGLERIVVAAPVFSTVSNEKVYVAVMLQRDQQSQRLYLHDAVSETEKELFALNGDHLNPTGSTEESKELSTTTILLNALDVKGNVNAISDTKYITLAEKFRDGSATEAETEQLRQTVEQAAKKAGYETPILYHGTNSFGFTEFDLSKMDDKRSIFATSSSDVARTYSGATGVRAISDRSMDISQMSDADVVDALNDYVKRYGDGLESVYSYVAPDAAKNISTDADKAAAELANLVRKKVSQYADKLADDFNDKDYKTHGQLVDLQEKLYLADRQTVLTPLYMLINHTDAFSGSNAETILRSLTLDHEVQKAQQNGLDISGGFYLRDELGGYMLSPISGEKARATLEGYNRMGNYALVGKTGKSLTVDANGGRWNEFRNSWTKPITDVITLESTFVDELDNYYYLLDKTTGNVLARAEKTDAIAEMSDDSRQIFLMNKAATLIRMETENIRTTREIAAYAKGKGYDSVIFRELIDNGGKSVGIDDAEATSDIYVVFDPAQYKSADLVTYDDNGEIIPLSERFKSDNNDIRYSIAFDDSISDEDLLWQLRLEDAQTNIERDQLEQAQTKAEKLKDLRAQLAEAKRQMQQTDHELNKTGLPHFSKETCRDFGIVDAEGQKYFREHLTDFYQSVLDEIDAGREAVAIRKLNQGAVEIANWLIDNGRVTEKVGYKWAVASFAHMYAQTTEDRAFIVADTAEKIYNDFMDHRYREAIQTTTADKIAKEAKDKYSGRLNEARQNLLSATEENVKLKEQNSALQQAKKFIQDNVDYQADRARRLQRQLDTAKKEAIDSGKVTKAQAQKIQSLKAQLAAAKEEARQWRNKSSHAGTYVRQLVASKNVDIRNLENQVARYEKILAGELRNPQLSRLLNEARTKAEAAMKAKKDQQMADYKESRKRTELIHKIGTVRAILQKRFTNPGDNTYIPIGLAESIIDVVNMIDSAPEEYVHGHGEMKGQMVPSETSAKYRNANEAMQAVYEQYIALQDNEDFTWSSEYDKETADHIKELISNLKERVGVGSSGKINPRGYEVRLGENGYEAVNRYTTDDLSDIYKTLREITATLSNATKLLAQDDRINVYQAMERLVDETLNSRRAKKNMAKKKGARAGELTNLNVMRAALLMSSMKEDAQLYKMWKTIESGEESATRYVMEYNKRLDALKNGKNELQYLDALNKKSDFGIKDADGKPVMMTKMQLMQAIMTWEREANNEKLKHIEKGFMEFRDASAIAKGDISAANKKAQSVKFDTEMYEEAQKHLTEWDKKFMETVREYLSDTEIGEVNEVMYQLKHRTISGEKYYFPVFTDKAYLATELEGKQDATNLFVKAPGSTKALIPNASTPIIIDGLDTVMSRHVQDVANYVGLALPIRDFAKVYNARQTSVEGVARMSAKKAIEKAWGDTATRLLEDNIRDVQKISRAGRDNSRTSKLAGKLQSVLVRSALVGRVSVVIKQAASYQAAGSVVSDRALLKHEAEIVPIFLAPGSEAAQKLFNEIDEHTSLHYNRRLGMSLQEIAEEKQKTNGIRKIASYAGAKLEQTSAGHFVRNALEVMNIETAIQRMDVATTAALWKACKSDVNQDYRKSKQKTGTDAYWEEVTRRYEKAIRETQPMYDALHRTEESKGKNLLASTLGLFKTVPYQNYGQLKIAVAAAEEARASGTKEQQKSANKHLIKTIWANTHSALVFSLLTLLSQALRHKMKKYRDDDDELTLESALAAYGKDVASVWASNISPIWGGLLIEAYDRISNESSFDVFSSGAIDMLNDSVTQANKLFNTIKKLNDGEASTKDLEDQILKTLLDAANYFGVPAENVYDMWSGIKENIDDFNKGNVPAFNNDVERTDGVNANRYIKAILSNDNAKADSVYEELYSNKYNKYLEIGMADAKAKAKAESETASKIKSTIREQYTDGDVSQRKAEKCLRSLGIEDNDIYWLFDEWDFKEKYAKEIKREEINYSMYHYLYDELEDGDPDFKEIYGYYEEHGVDKDKVKNITVSYIKDAYGSGRFTRNESESLLQKWLKLDKDESYWKVEAWEQTANNSDDPDYHFGEYNEMKEAIDKNTPAATAFKYLKDGGYTDNQIKDEAKKYIVSEYKEGKITAKQLSGRLAQYCGITKTEDIETIQYNADWKNAYPDYQIDESQAYKYYKKLKGVVSADAWYKYLTQSKDFHGDGKKSRQVDLIYQVCGYNRSKALAMYDAIFPNDSEDTRYKWTKNW